MVFLVLENVTYILFGVALSHRGEYLEYLQLHFHSCGIGSKEPGHAFDEAVGCLII